MRLFSSAKVSSRVTQSRWGNYRPSYLPLRNAPNRILSRFREAVQQGDFYATPADWLVNLSDMNADSEAWRLPAEVEHAERVLTRLARLTTLRPVIAPGISSQAGIASFRSIITTKENTPVKINAEQQRLLDDVTRADANYRSERTAAYERAKLAADKEVEAAKIKRDIAAYWAAEGVPITGTSGMAQRDVGLHTTASKTIYDAIENGKKYALTPTDAATVTINAAGIEYDPEVAIVTIDGVRFTVETNLAGKRILEPAYVTDEEPAQGIYASGRDREALAWLDANYPEEVAA